MEDFDQDLENALLFSDASRGIYIPQHFALELVDSARIVFQYDCDDWDVIKPILLAGPDHDDYWEVWTRTLDYAQIHHDGRVYSLYQDGDLFLLPESN